MKEFMERASAGDRQAMTELYEKYWKDAKAICSERLGDTELADANVVKAFQSTWDYLLNDCIKTEEEFQATLCRQASLLCRKKSGKKGTKAVERETVSLSEACHKQIAADIDARATPLEKKRMLKRVLCAAGVLAAAAIVGVVCIAAGNKKEPLEFTANTTKGTSTSADNMQDTDAGAVAESETEFVFYADEQYYADIDIEGYGVITVKLDYEAAPATVENFVALAESGFYDGLTFHRIMEGFMMQGGDPLGNGTGGSDKNIVGEFAENGHENNLSHNRGVISMARSSAYDSASSQFFIVQEDSTFLDGKYAAFGYVIEGMDVVDAVCTKAEPTDDNGTILAEKQPVISTIHIWHEAVEEVK